ncbi:MAG: hypothetical protein CMJ85_12950, partial [Planctomycetes bacterium]|nr:hypothetical protein [Planctomycetota bacterium]
LSAIGVAAQAVVFPAGADRVEVPMRLLGSGAFGVLPAIELVIGEKRGWFVADTGAGTVLMTPELLADLGVEGRGKIPMMGVTERASTKVYRLPECRLGALRMKGVKAISHDMSSLCEKLGAEVSGLLGNAAFTGQVVTFDFACRKLIVHRGETFTAPPGATRVKVEYALGIPSVRASIGGRRFARYLLDTGNQVGVLLNGPWVARRKLLAEPGRFPSIGVGGIGSDRAVRLALAPDLRIGRGTDLIVRDVPVGMAGKRAGGLLGDAVRAGNIGTPVLERFRFTLDFLREVAWFEPRADVPNRVEPWFGFTMRVRKGAVQIRAVVPTSPAEVAGLKGWNKLLWVDGAPVAGLDISAIVARLRKLDRVRLVLERRLHKGASQQDQLRVELTRTNFLPALPGPRRSK